MTGTWISQKKTGSRTGFIEHLCFNHRIMQQATPRQRAKKNVKDGGALFGDAFKELMKNDPLRMAGATAFFTTFALPPILIILFQLMRLFISPETIRAELFQSLSETVGREAVEQLVNVLRAIRGLAYNWPVTIGGFIFLLFVATTLFKVIKNSLNQVWKIRPVNKKGIIRKFRTRMHSVFVIVVAGMLFIAGIMAEALQAFVGDYLREYSPLLSIYFNNVLNLLISVVIVTLWFSIVFRYLPDGRPGWSIALTGGLLTSFLFNIGKILLHWLLTYSNINTLYGTSASIVLLLLFVFYSAFILYYGAAFTKVWAIYRDRPIKPLPHAMHYRLIESEVEEWEMNHPHR
jgi:membrane protein